MVCVPSANKLLIVCSNGCDEVERIGRIVDTVGTVGV